MAPGIAQEQMQRTSTEQSQQHLEPEHIRNLLTYLSCPLELRKRAD